MAGSRILYFTTTGKRTTQKVWKSLTSKGLVPEIKIPSRLTKSQQAIYKELKKEYRFKTVNKDYKPRHKSKRHKKFIPKFVDKPLLEVNYFDSTIPDTSDDIPPLLHDAEIDIEAEEIVDDRFDLLDDLKEVKNFITSP